MVILETAKKASQAGADMAVGMVRKRLVRAHVPRSRPRCSSDVAAGKGGTAAADFHPFSTIIEIRITNIGTTLARDVRFKFTPPLATTHDDTPGRSNLMNLNLFQEGISSLAPGKEIRLFFDQFPARVGAKLPMAYE